MPRPELLVSLSPGAFAQHYWLKSELVEFCRAQGLSASGGKLEISARVEAFLRTGERLKQNPVRRQTVSLSGSITLDTVIPEGCRASQSLRALFEQELGPKFHFNGFIRDYLRDNPGQTLGDAARAWQADQACGPRRSDIAPQFEFNRHIRAYFEQHPGATRQQAVDDWNRTRQRPGATTL